MLTEEDANFKSSGSDASIDEVNKRGMVEEEEEQQKNERSGDCDMPWYIHSKLVVMQVG
jgi:hypothetical protein